MERSHSLIAVAIRRSDDSTSPPVQPAQLLTVIGARTSWGRRGCRPPRPEACGGHANTIVWFLEFFCNRRMSKVLHLRVRFDVVNGSTLIIIIVIKVNLYTAPKSRKSLGVILCNRKTQRSYCRLQKVHRFRLKMCQKSFIGRYDRQTIFDRFLIHFKAETARQTLSLARCQVCILLGCNPPDPVRL